MFYPYQGGDMLHRQSQRPQPMPLWCGFFHETPPTLQQSLRLPCHSWTGPRYDHGPSPSLRAGDSPLPLKCLQEIQEVRFTGTGKADDGVFGAFLLACDPGKFGPAETVRAIKNMQFRLFMIGNGHLLRPFHSSSGEDLLIDWQSNGCRQVPNYRPEFSR
jgi:hypothetical protein